MLRWFINSLHPFPPRGMRHTALPTTGVLVRGELWSTGAPLHRATFCRPVVWLSASLEPPLPDRPPLHPSPSQARNRAIAMKVAQTRALIERDSSTACSSEAEWAGLSERGGQAAFELLAGLPTLQRLNAVRAEELAASTCAHCSHLLHAPDVEQAAGSPKRAERRPLSAPTSPARHGWRLGDSL